MVNIGEAEILHMIVHIVVKILGKAGAGSCRAFCGQDAKHQRCCRAKHQKQRFYDNSPHILQLDAVVIEVGHDKGDQNLHGDFTCHGKGCEDSRLFIFPDTLGQSSDHGCPTLLVFLCLLTSIYPTSFPKYAFYEQAYCRELC